MTEPESGQFNGYNGCSTNKITWFSCMTDSLVSCGVLVRHTGIICGLRLGNLDMPWCGRWMEFTNGLQLCHYFDVYKNIKWHTAHTIVSWPNPKQWVIVHTSDLMMIIRQSIYVLSIITREMGKLKTHSLTYCIMDNWENMLNLTHSRKYIWQAFYKFSVFR